MGKKKGEGAPGAGVGFSWAETADGELLINGAPVARADMKAKRFRSLTSWALNLDAETMEGLMGPEDSAWCSRQGGTASYTYKCTKKESFHVMPSAVWGVEEPTARQCAEKIWQLKSLSAELLEDGPGRTLASTAGKITRRHGAQGFRALPPQYRALAHAAVHGGPMVCLRGGGPDVVEYDRSRAFLESMKLPLPTSWAPFPGARWEDLTEEDEGICRAVCWLDPDLWIGKLPPLPVKTAGGTLYPVGVVGGVWTLSLLRQAVSLGAEVVEIQDLILCSTSPIHRASAEKIEQIPDPELRKLLYLRAWGRWASCGGYKGTLEKQEETDVKFQGSKLWWRWDGLTLGGPAQEDYRPDWAAFVASYNQIRMNEVIAGLQPEQLIASHVDALWIDQSLGPVPLPDGFKLANSGPARWYKTGTYHHGEKWAAQGCPWEIQHEADMVRWLGENPTSDAWIRRWRDNVSASVSAGASSDPPLHRRVYQLENPEIPRASRAELWSNGWPVSEELKKKLSTLTILDVW